MGRIAKKPKQLFRTSLKTAGGKDVSIRGLKSGSADAQDDVQVLEFCCQAIKDFIPYSEDGLVQIRSEDELRSAFSTQRIEVEMHKSQQELYAQSNIESLKSKRNDVNIVTTDFITTQTLGDRQLNQSLKKYILPRLHDGMGKWLDQDGRYDQIFTAVTRNRLDAPFVEVLKNKNRCVLPDTTLKRYIAWKKNHPEILTMPRAGVNEILVDHDLLDKGALSQDMRNGGDDEVQKKRTVEDVQHTELVFDALLNELDLVGAVDHYKPRADQASGDARNAPYHVIEFSFKASDGVEKTHQVATQDWKSRGTFVIKEPVDLSPDQDTHRHEIADLVKRGEAWPVACHNEEQYKRSIIELCLRDINEMKPHMADIHWADHHADELFDSVYKYVIATGHEPRSHDRSMITVGKLAGKAEWERAYMALNRHHIPGFSEDVKTFRDIMRYMHIVYPDLKMHMEKPKISAVELSNAIYDAKTLDETVEIDGHQVNLSHLFTEKSSVLVTDTDDVFPEVKKGYCPEKIEDFVDTASVFEDIMNG